MKISELRALDSTDLLDKLEEFREELFKQRLNWHAGSLEDPNTLKRLRHDIARMLTVLRERELAAEIVRLEGEKNDQ